MHPFVEGFKAELEKLSAADLKDAFRKFDPSKMNVDRPKGTKRGPIVYPMDYGEMTNLKGPDGEGFDVFVLPGHKLGPKTRVIGGTYTSDNEPKLIVGSKLDRKKVDRVLKFMRDVNKEFVGKDYKPKFVKAGGARELPKVAIEKRSTTSGKVWAAIRKRMTNAPTLAFDAGGRTTYKLRPAGETPKGITGFPTMRAGNSAEARMQHYGQLERDLRSGKSGDALKVPSARTKARTAVSEVRQLYPKSWEEKLRGEAKDIMNVKD